jgi:hypothetical protein
MSCKMAGFRRAITGTNPKSLSGRMSDRANMRGRVPQPAGRSRGRSRKPRGPRGNLASPVAVDSDGARSWRAFCALGVSIAAGLLPGLRNGPQSNVPMLVQMTSREPLKSFRRLQVFASHSACQREEELYDKPNYCPRRSLSGWFCGSRNWRQP